MSKDAKQAEEWLVEDLNNLKYMLSDKYEWFLPAPTEVKRIVTNMAYQLGINAFSKFRKTIHFISKKKYTKVKRICPRVVVIPNV